MKYIGIDYGHKRIGLAVSDVLGFMAMPLEIIERQSLQKDVSVIKNIVEKYAIESIVVGLPVNMDGSEGPLAEQARDFGEKLLEEIKIPVEYFDERLTTAQTERMLVEEADMSREKRKLVRDKIAATYMLQAYLDCNQSKSL